MNLASLLITLWLSLCGTAQAAQAPVQAQAPMAQLSPGLEPDLGDTKARYLLERRLYRLGAITVLGGGVALVPITMFALLAALSQNNIAALSTLTLVGLDTALINAGALAAGLGALRATRISASASGSRASVALAIASFVMLAVGPIAPLLGGADLMPLLLVAPVASLALSGSQMLIARRDARSGGLALVPSPGGASLALVF